MTFTAASSPSWATPATTWATRLWSSAPSSAWTSAPVAPGSKCPPMSSWTGAARSRPRPAPPSRSPRTLTRVPRVPPSSTPTSGSPWVSRATCGASASSFSPSTRSTPSSWQRPLPTPSSCTACRASTTATRPSARTSTRSSACLSSRSPTRSSSPLARASSTRPRTACTPSRPSCTPPPRSRTPRNPMRKRKGRGPRPNWSRAPLV